MIPFYIFYSMFGFQRTGDQFWQLADQLGRGFVLGATAGRTTLTGEGLQHADGHSLLLASTNPAVRGLRPGVRVRDRAHRPRRPAADVRPAQYGAAASDRDVFYYLTVYNEPITQPAEPDDLDVDGLLRGHLPLLPRTRHRRTGRARRCSRPASRCRGRSRRSGCWARSGASTSTSGR